MSAKLPKRGNHQAVKRLSNRPSKIFTKAEVEAMKTSPKYKNVASFGNEKYVAMHDEIIQEIQNNHREQAELLLKDTKIIN